MKIITFYTVHIVIIIERICCIAKVRFTNVLNNNNNNLI